MTDNKQDPPVDPNATEKPGETDRKVAEPKEPTFEELKTQNAELVSEKEHKEAEIKRLQGIAKDAQRRGIPKEEITALHKKIDDMQESHALMMDDLAQRVSGEESPTPSKKSYHQQLLDKRAAIKPEPQDPEAQKFFSYLEGQGLDIQDPLVQEAVGEDRTPQEALKYLKDKVKGQGQPETDKQVEKARTEEREKVYKDLGLTASGAGAPSAAAKDFSSMSADEKLQEGFKQIKEKK